MKAAAGRARRLLARSRLPTFRGYAHSAPRYGLLGAGCLKQMPNAVFQQFDSPLQSAELSNPHDCDGQVQLNGGGAQHFNRVERAAANKARRKQPESTSCLTERQLEMHVVDFSRNP